MATMDDESFDRLLRGALDDEPADAGFSNAVLARVRPRVRTRRRDDPWRGALPMAVAAVGAALPALFGSATLDGGVATAVLTLLASWWAWRYARSHA